MTRYITSLRMAL